MEKSEDKDVDAGGRKSNQGSEDGTLPDSADMKVANPGANQGVKEHAGEENIDSSGIAVQGDDRKIWQ